MRSCCSFAVASADVVGEALDDEVASVDELESVEELALSGGGGPGGKPKGLVVPGVDELPVASDVPSIEDVASEPPRSLAIVLSRLCNCFKSAASASDDVGEMEPAPVVPAVVEEEDPSDEDVPSLLSDASRLVASLDDVIEPTLSDGGGPGGEPGGGPPAP